MNVSRLIELNHSVAPPTVKPPKPDATESFHDVITAAVQSKQPKAKPRENESEAQAAVSNEKPVEAKPKDEDHDAAKTDDTSAAAQVAQTSTPVKTQDPKTDNADTDADADVVDAASANACSSAAKAEVAGQLKLQKPELPTPGAAPQATDADDANPAKEAVQVADTKVAEPATAVKIQQNAAAAQVAVNEKVQAKSPVPVVASKTAKRTEPKAEAAKFNTASATDADETHTASNGAHGSSDVQVQSDVSSEPQAAQPAQAPQHSAETKPVKSKSETAASSDSASRRTGDALPGNVTLESTQPGQPVDAPIDFSAASTAISSNADAGAGGTAHAASAKPADGAEAASGTKAASADNEAAKLSEQATRALRSVVNQKGGSVTLRLTPPELGALRVRVEMNNSLVSARFEAETEGVRSVLQQNLSTLRSALESQGLTVQSLHVQLSPQSGPQDQSLGGGDDGRSRGSFDQRQSSDHGSGGDEARQRAAQRQAAFERQLNLVA